MLNANLGNFAYLLSDVCFLTLLGSFFIKMSLDPPVSCNIFFSLKVKELQSLCSLLRKLYERTY